MPGEKRARRKPVHAWYDRDYATSQHGSIDRQALMLSNKPTRRTPDDPPLQQGLVEMATVGAQSVLWLVLAGAILAAVAGAAVIAWSLRPVPLYLSERVKRGSPFDVEFWMENTSAWFPMSRLAIRCTLVYPGAPDLAVAANDVQLPGHATDLRPGEMAVFKCPFPATLKGTDETGVATRAELYFQIEYDMPVFGLFRLSDDRGPFVLNTRLLPPRWMGRSDR